MLIRTGVGGAPPSVIRIQTRTAMLTSPASLFSKSLLAAAVLAATGCASTAPQPTDDTGFSGPLVEAGRATAGLTTRALRRTGYLLGLHDGADDADRLDGTPPMDEVDLVMLEEDAVMPTQPRPVTLDVVDRIDALPGSDTPLGDGAVQSGDPVHGSAVARFVAADGSAPLSGSEGLTTEATMATERPIDAPMTVVVALNDFTHTVDTDETLWDIAKATTGDATNWHALADVNDLGQNASVYPGQQLIIPADMLRPERVDAGARSTPDADPSPEPSAIALARAPLTDPLLDTASDGADKAQATLPDIAGVAGSPVAPAPESPSHDARGFVVEPGESLWEFARRTTGDATEWQRIAAHNGFDEQRARTIRQGEQIFVPEALVRVDISVAVAPTGDQGALQPDRAPATEPGDVRDGERISPRLVPIAAASEALPAEAALSAATAPDESSEDLPAQASTDTQDMTIVEASYREPQDSNAATAAADTPAEVMISGTYYPKAIYNEADFSSSLLMRVSPGTRLRVANVDGAWYAVETEDGVGYVHDRDIR